MTIFKQIMLTIVLVTFAITNKISADIIDRAAMQREINKVHEKEKTDRVVCGDLFRIPSGIGQAGHDDIAELKKNGYEVEVSENDVLLRVWATSKGYPDTLIVHLSEDERNDPEGSCNWANHGHPCLHKFPSYLPLKLFIDEAGQLKKDGDEVVIYHNNPKTNERIKIILILNQRGYRYARCGNDYFDGKYHDGGFDNCVIASRDYEELVKPYLSNKN